MMFDEWITVMTDWYFNGGATLADVVKRAYEKGKDDGYAEGMEYTIRRVNTQLNELMEAW